MARKVRHSRLESRSSRLKLPVRKKPYTGPRLFDGIILLYRRNRGNGTWIAKVRALSGTAYWTKSIGLADDYDDGNGEKILTFYEAQDKAKQLARGDNGEVASNSAAPVTLDQTLTKYEADLEARGALTYNARRPRVHLTPSLLSKPVQFLTTSELEDWRNGLLSKLSAASINRLCNSLCAGLELAAKRDKRITNRDAWEVGLAGLPGAGRARNVVLPDATVHAFVAAAYARDAKLGLLIDTLAVTGTRPSQAIRLVVEDLHAHPARPKLMMPKSGKGGGRDRAARKDERFSVPVTPALAARLKAAAKGRSPDARLLVRSDGRPWSEDPSQDYRREVRPIVEGLGLDPDLVTTYALRHSSIVRMLLKNVPIRLVASLHDTSVSQIERNYSKHIVEYADEHARAALLEDRPASTSPPADNVVVPIGGR
jgi:integrase